MARKSEDNATNDAMDLLEDRGSSIVVPQAPQTETRRTSRRGGSSRTASRSSSPGESLGLPEEDETDEGENMELGNFRFLRLLVAQDLMNNNNPMENIFIGIISTILVIF